MSVLAYSILGLVATICSHALVARCFPRGNRVAQFLCCAVGGATTLLLVVGQGSAQSGLEISAAVSVFAFGSELYVFSFTFVISSIAASLLIGGVIPPPGSTSDMVRERIRRMTDTGLLSHDGEVVRITPRGRLLVWIFRSLRHFFRHETAPEFVANEVMGGGNSAK